jgi:hypothetical protein
VFIPLVGPSREFSDGDDEIDELKLNTAAVAAEEAVERKEVRRARPWLSGFDVPEWQELAGGRAGVGGGAQEHQGAGLTLQPQDRRRTAPRGSKNSSPVDADSHYLFYLLFLLFAMSSGAQTLRIRKRPRKAAESTTVAIKSGTTSPADKPISKKSKHGAKKDDWQTTGPAMRPSTVKNDDWQTCKESWEDIAPFLQSYKKRRIWQPFFYDGKCGQVNTLFTF